MPQDIAGGALLILGGGRWARVYLSVLAGLATPCPKTIVISRHGGVALADAIARANARQPDRFSLASDLDTVLAVEAVSAAIIVNASRDHAASALALLERKIPVLVEKPVTLTVADAVRLVAAAKATNTALMPGHVLSFCSYLENFAAAVRTLGLPQSVELHWQDPTGETRYGESKDHDPSLGVAEDVGPHLFAILSQLSGGGTGTVEKVLIERGGLSVRLAGSWNGIPMTLVLARNSERRERLVIVKGPDGREAKLDFSTEPGTITKEGRSTSADPQWPHSQGPLALQLAAFLKMRGADDHTSQSIIDATFFTAQMAEQIRKNQAAWLASPDWAAAPPDEQLVALCELLAPLLQDAGCWRAGDNAALEVLVRRALAEMAGKSPRPTPAELVRALCPGAKLAE